MTAQHFRNSDLVKSHRFSVFHLNARSLRNKFDETNLLLSDLKHDFDLITFSETWFTSHEDCYSLPGYECLSASRTGKGGGGILIYVRSTHQYKTISEYSVVNENIECLTLQCYDTLFAVVYRPPSGSIPEFFEFIENLLEFSVLIKMQILLIGDFNINASPENVIYQQFQEIFQSYACTNTIHSPTRITPETETTIDLCITSFLPEEIESGTIMCAISDHFPIYCKIPCKMSHISPCSSLSRMYSKEKYH